MEIVEILNGKKQYLPLLLIGDESEAMIDRYLADGHLFVGFIGKEPIAVCVVLELDSSTAKVKNLAVHPSFRRQGYGRRMLADAESRYPGRTIILGTGETPSTLRFYISTGYSIYRRVPDFFIDNYPAPIIEEGVQLKDMIYLRKLPEAPR